jgi:flagellar basal body rod protein FlgG
MSQLIDAQRSYELSSRAIKTQDELLDVANQIVRS